MPRRNRPPKREIAPDIKYNSVLVSQFINKLMVDGKKSTAQSVFYDALDIVESRARRSGSTSRSPGRGSGSRSGRAGAFPRRSGCRWD